MDRNQKTQMVNVVVDVLTRMRGIETGEIPQPDFDSLDKLGRTWREWVEDIVDFIDQSNLQLVDWCNDCIWEVANAYVNKRGEQLIYEATEHSHCECSNSLTVRELIERLSIYDPNWPVWIGDHATETCCDISHIVDNSDDHDPEPDIVAVLIFPKQSESPSKSEDALHRLLALTASFCSTHRSSELAKAQEAGAEALGYSGMEELVSDLRENHANGQN